MAKTINLIKDKNGRFIYRSNPTRRRLAFGGFAEGGLQGVSTGLGIGSMFGPIGAAVGAGVGLIAGGIRGSEMENREGQRRAMAEFRANNDRNRLAKSIRDQKDMTELQDYPTQGYGYSGYYANGGRIRKSFGQSYANGGIILVGDDSPQQRKYKQNRVATDNIARAKNRKKRLSANQVDENNPMNKIAVDTANEYFGNPNNDLMIYPNKKLKRYRRNRFVNGGELDNDNTTARKYPIGLKLLGDNITSQRNDVKTLPGYGYSGQIDIDNEYDPILNLMGSGALAKAIYKTSGLRKLAEGSARKVASKQIDDAMLGVAQDVIHTKRMKELSKAVKAEKRMAAIGNDDYGKYMDDVDDFDLLKTSFFQDPTQYNKAAKQGIKYKGKTIDLKATPFNREMHRRSLDETDKVLVPGYKKGHDDLFLHHEQTPYDRFNMLYDDFRVLPSKNAYGGRISALDQSRHLQGGAAIPLASNALKIKGDTHSQDTDGDGLTGVDYKGNEVEDGEIIYKTSDGTDLVFSKRLGFANAVEPLIQQKAKFEKKANTTDQIAKNTALRQLTILDDKVNQLFEQQEAVNQQMEQQQPQQQMAYGGKIRRKMFTGGIADGDTTTWNPYPGVNIADSNLSKWYMPGAGDITSAKRQILEKANLLPENQRAEQINNEVAYWESKYGGGNDRVAMKTINTPVRGAGNIDSRENPIVSIFPSNRFGNATIRSNNGMNRMTAQPYQEATGYGQRARYSLDNTPSYIWGKNKHSVPEYNDAYNEIRTAYNQPQAPAYKKGVRYNPMSGNTADFIGPPVAPNTQTTINTPVNNNVERVPSIRRTPALTAPQITRKQVQQVPYKGGEFDPDTIDETLDFNLDDSQTGSTKSSFKLGPNFTRNATNALQALTPIASYITDRNALNKINPNVPAPIAIPDVRLNTDVDVSAQLNELDNTGQALSREIDNNTSNSNVAIARKIALRNKVALGKNQIRSGQIASEKQLQNLNRSNTQQVTAANTAATNRFARDQFDHTNAGVMARNRATSGLYQNLQNVMTNVQKGQFQNEQLDIIAAQYGITLTKGTPEEMRQEFIRKTQERINQMLANR